MHINKQIVVIFSRITLAAMYASKFKQLVCNISWDEVAFMNQFQFELCNNAKDLILTKSFNIELNHCTSCSI